MKLGLVAASLILVAGGAVGCGDDGGGDGASSDKTASKDDFCAAFQSFYDDLTSVAPDAENLGKVIKDAADKIEEVGTPEDIPDDAKAGLGITLDAINDLPDDASQEDVIQIESSFSDDEKKKTDAFNDYLAKTCPDIGTSG
jgi:hypothetical protein